MFRFQLGEGYLRIFQLWECSEHALGLVLAQPSGAVRCLCRGIWANAESAWGSYQNPFICLGKSMA